jgi:hypothetical protein
MAYTMIYNISTVAVGDYHIKNIVNLLKDSRLDIYNFNVLTDKPIKFLFKKNVSTIKYTKDIFSYHDKRIVIQNSLSKYEHTVFLDADHLLVDKNILFPKIVPYEFGIHPSIVWKSPSDCSLENFLKGNVERVPYGTIINEICKNLNIKSLDAYHIQESMFMVTNCDNIDYFFDTWKFLQEICDSVDRRRNQKILGYGEGYSIALSAKEANIPIIENSSFMNSLKEIFIHKAWLN